MGGLEQCPTYLGMETLTRVDWRTGYLEQAHSDYEMYQRLERAGDVALCHRLHYLQMATEKLAKGFLTPAGGAPYEYTHKAFLRLIRDASNMSRVRRRLGRTGQYAAYRSFLRSVEPLAETIQNLSPEGDDHPNPEYPWRDGAGHVQSPLHHTFAGMEARDNPRLRELLGFVEILFAIANEEKGAAV